MGDDKIIDRIKKLLGMAHGRGTTPAEAASFAAEAQRLMAQHGLDSATVMARGLAKGHEHDGPVGAHRASEKTSRRRIIWQGRLASTIAECGGGDMYWQNDWIYENGQRIVSVSTMFIGRPTQVEGWRVMYEWLCDEVDHLCKSALVDLPSWENSRNYANAFRLGAVDTICRRLRDSARNQHIEFEKLAEEELAETIVRPDGTNAMVHVRRDALAIMDQQRAEIQEYKKSGLGFKLKRGAPNRGGRRSSDGYNDGRVAGESVDLHTKMPVR